MALNKPSDLPSNDSYNQTEVLSNLFMQENGLMLITQSFRGKPET